MKTKLNKLAALAVAATFFANVANAEIKAGPLTLTPGIIFESSKISEFAGTIGNRSQASAGVDLNITHSSGIYLYSAYKQEKVYTSTEEADGSGKVDYEFCNSLGFAKSFNKLNLDLSYENCYLEDAIADPENVGVYYARASYNVNDKLLVGGAYALSDTEGDDLFAADGTTVIGELVESAYKFYGTFNAGPADITLTYGEAENLTDYYKVGLSKEVVGINFDLSYWDVSGDSFLNTKAAGTSSIFDTEFLVFTAKNKF